MSPPLIRATKLMIIRHAEKPAKAHPKRPPFGLTPEGVVDPESLTIRGWQRAGALAAFFGTSLVVQPQLGAIATPTVVYASAVVHPHHQDDNTKVGSRSKRPQQTVTPLLEKLGQAVEADFTFTKGQEQALVRSALACTGVVLICWEHKHIPLIGAAIPVDLTISESPPPSWPLDADGQSRYDVVWVFDLDTKTQQYSFRQVAQGLLMGDRPQ